MKRFLLPGLLLATLFSACKKEDNTTPQTTGGPALQVFGVPIPGIFTWVEDSDTWGYLQADDFGGFVFKGSVVNTYPLSDLATDANCRIEMIGRDLTNGPVAYGVNMPGTEDWWVPIDQSGDLVLKQVDLGLALTEMPDIGGYWCWIRHHKGTVDGQPVYAMESYTYPGMYWSLQGTMSGADLVKLVEHQDPANAQGFIFR